VVGFHGFPVTVLLRFRLKAAAATVTFGRDGWDSASARPAKCAECGLAPTLKWDVRKHIPRVWRQGCRCCRAECSLEFVSPNRPSHTQDIVGDSRRTFDMVPTK
jgi:hypothetical protein